MSNLLKTSFFLTMLAMVAISGCANYEVNTNRGNVPGHYIRTEMQEADRAIDAARQAGKDKICPSEFKAAEDAKNNAYDVFRSCRTEEGAALAKQATAKANALCQMKQPAPIAVPSEQACAPTVINIKFDTNKAAIKPIYHGELKKLADFLKKFPNAKGVIEGHTDSVGDKASNMVLSQNRADSVRNYIIKNFGIAPERISAKGFGPTKPIAGNDTAEGKQKNRRIEANFTCDNN